MQIGFKCFFLPHIVVQVLFFKLCSVELQEGEKKRTKKKLFEHSYHSNFPKVLAERG